MIKIARVRSFVINSTTIMFLTGGESFWRSKKRPAMVLERWCPAGLKASAYQTTNDEGTRVSIGTCPPWPRSHGAIIQMACRGLIILSALPVITTENITSENIRCFSSASPHGWDSGEIRVTGAPSRGRSFACCGVAGEVDFGLGYWVRPFCCKYSYRSVMISMWFLYCAV